MIIYVAHSYLGIPDNLKRARRICHDLQVRDKENTYLSPLLAFSHLAYGEMPFNEEMDLCLDLLMVCDKLIVASEVTRGVQIEIDFANSVGMEVEYLERSE